MSLRKCQAVAKFNPHLLHDGIVRGCVIVLGAINVLQELLVSGVDTIIGLVVHIYVTVCGTSSPEIEKVRMACCYPYCHSVDHLHVCASRHLVCELG